MNSQFQEILTKLAKVPQCVKDQEFDDSLNHIESYLASEILELESKKNKILTNFNTQKHNLIEKADYESIRDFLKTAELYREFETLINLNFQEDLEDYQKLFKELDPLEDVIEESKDLLLNKKQVTLAFTKCWETYIKLKNLLPQTDDEITITEDYISALLTTRSKLIELLSNCEKLFSVANFQNQQFYHHVNGLLNKTKSYLQDELIISVLTETFKIDNNKNEIILSSTEYDKIMSILKYTGDEYISIIKENMKEKLKAIIEFFKKNRSIKISRSDDEITFYCDNKERKNRAKGTSSSRNNSDNDNDSRSGSVDSDKSVDDKKIDINLFKEYFSIKSEFIRFLKQSDAEKLDFHTFEKHFLLAIKDKVRDDLFKIVGSLSEAEKLSLREEFLILNEWIVDSQEGDFADLIDIFDNFKILSILNEGDQKLISYKNSLYKEVLNIKGPQSISDKFSRIFHEIIDQLISHLQVFKGITNQAFIEKLLDLELLTLNLLSYMMKEYEQTLEQNSVPLHNISSQLYVNTTIFEDYIESLLEYLELINFPNKKNYKSKLIDLYQVTNIKEIDLLIDIKNTV